MLESELPAAMGEAMISNTPQPYEEPQTIHIVAQFDNQAYESGHLNIPRLSTNSYILNAEEGIYCEASMPIDRNTDQDEGIYSEANTPVYNSEIYESIDDSDSAFNCKSPPPHIKALYAVVDKKTLVCLAISDYQSYAYKISALFFHSASHLLLSPERVCCIITTTKHWKRYCSTHRLRI